MKEIQLTQGKVALVDDADYEELSKYKWQAAKRNGDNFYAIRYLRDGDKKTSILMHVEVMTTRGTGIQIDHKNQDGLDNQRANLRKATSSQNNHNRRKGANQKSRFKGVSWYSAKDRWHASIKVNYHTHHLGFYKDESEAALAYNEAAIKHFGDFAVLNSF